ncbi:MAG: FlgB family protein [Roseobacter sp.]
MEIFEISARTASKLEWLVIKILLFSQTVFKGIRVKPWLILFEGEAPMFENLDVFKISGAMAKHAGERQAVISQNMAHADTPRYQARDIPTFKSDYEMTNSMAQKATRTGHLGDVSNMKLAPSFTEEIAGSPDGNTVSIEDQMLKANETMRQHDKALAIYKSALGILRSSLGRS